MNYQQKRIFTLAGAAGLVLLAAFQTMAWGQTGTERSATIQLHVVPNGSAYDLTKTGRLVCNAARPEGCIQVPQGDTARIAFTLASTSGWHLTSITICEQGDSDPCRLSPAQRADFEITEDGTGSPQSPDRNGVVDLTVLGADLQGFVLFDKNTVPQDYEYTIEACDDEACTTMDPPLENGGRK